MRTLFLILCFYTASIAANQYPMVIDPTITATPPGAKVSAGYLSLMNQSDKIFTITGAYSPDVVKVEIHRSSVENDIAKMEKQESVSIEPGATLKFEHGSYHIMLMGLTKPLKEGDTISVILITSSGDMLIEMPVMKLGASMTEHKHDTMGKQDHSENMAGDTDSMPAHDAKKDGDNHKDATKVVY